jgi:ribulose-phosphate 3-epimerase
MSVNNKKIAPSILSADFANFETSIASILSADLLHLDVMDNHFVPNITFGTSTVKRIAEFAKMPLDVHLMIENPDIWSLDYVFPNVDSITFHLSATKAPIRLARKLRQMGVKASIAINPSEPVEPLFDILNEFDMVLVMTVEPGFGSQEFLKSQIQKIKKLKQAIEQAKVNTLIQVDGGVSHSNIQALSRAGADVFVAGNAVFNPKFNPNLNAQSPDKQIQTLKELVQNDNFITA